MTGRGIETYIQGQGAWDMDEDGQLRREGDPDGQPIMVIGAEGPASPQQKRAEDSTLGGASSGATLAFMEAAASSRVPGGPVSTEAVTTRFWTPPRAQAGSKQQIKFAISCPQGMSSLLSMKVEYAFVGSWVADTPPEHMFMTVDMPVHAESGVCASDWIPLLPTPSTSQSVVFYRYRAAVVSPAHGAAVYTEDDVRTLEVLAAQAVRHFDLLEPGAWVFENSTFEVEQSITATVAPLHEQLRIYGSILFDAPSKPAWASAVRGLCFSWERLPGLSWDERREAACQAVSQLAQDHVGSGHKNNKNNKGLSSPFAQLTMLVMLGLCDPRGTGSGGLPASFPSGPLLECVEEEAVAMVGPQDAGLRKLTQHGLRSLVSHDVAHGGDYAWLPLLFWRSVDMTTHILQARLRTQGQGQAGAEGEANKGAFSTPSAYVSRAASLLEPLCGGEEWGSTLETLLSHAPGLADRIELLLSAFRHPRASSSDTSLLRHVASPRLVELMGSRRGHISPPLEKLMRRTLVARAASEGVGSPALLPQAVECFNLRDTEIKPMLSHMLADPGGVEGALAAALAPGVADRFHPQDPFPIDLCRKWFAANVDRASTTTGGADPLLSVASVLRRGLAATKGRDERMHRELRACASERLGQLQGGASVLKAVRPLASALAVAGPGVGDEREREATAEASALVWEEAVSPTLARWAQPPSGEKYRDALKLLGLGGAAAAEGGGLDGSQGGARGGLVDKAVDSLIHEFSKNVLENPCPSGDDAESSSSRALLPPMLEYADFWSTVFAQLQAGRLAGLRGSSSAYAKSLMGSMQQRLAAISSGDVTVGELQDLCEHKGFEGPLSTYSAVLDPPSEHKSVEQLSSLRPLVGRLQGSLEMLSGFLHGFTDGRRVPDPELDLSRSGGEASKPLPATWRAFDLPAHLQVLEQLRRDFRSHRLRDVRVGLGDEEASVISFDASTPTLQPQPHTPDDGWEGPQAEEGEGEREGARLWGPLAMLLSAARRLHELRLSTVARNAWELAASRWLDTKDRRTGRGRAVVTVRTLASEVVPLALDHLLPGFLRECENEASSLPLSKVAALLYDVDPSSLEEEMALLGHGRVLDHDWQPSPHMMSSLSTFLRLPELTQYSAAVRNLSSSLGVVERSLPLLQQSDEIEALCDPSTWSMTHVQQMMVCVQSFRGRLEPLWESMPLFVELGAAPALLDLVRDLHAEDSLNLIDAVEEHGEATVRVETVSDLDTISRVLRPAFNAAHPPRDDNAQPAGPAGPFAPPPTTPTNIMGERERERKMGPDVLELMGMIRDCVLRNTGTRSRQSNSPQALISRMAARTRMCATQVHALRDMFKNVANRQELTKTLARRLREHGLFLFELSDEGEDSDKPFFTVRAEVEGSGAGPGSAPQSYNQSRLEDLKGRALLQVNSHANGATLGPLDESDEARVSMEEQAEAHERTRGELRAFIESTNLALHMASELSALYELGHFGYYDDFRAALKVDREAMAEACRRVKQDKDEWASALATLRRKYYYLNFFYFSHYGTLVDFLVGSFAPDAPETQTALDLLQFVRPSLDAPTLLHEWHGIAVDKAGVEEAKGDAAHEENGHWFLRGLHDPNASERLRALAATLDVLFDSTEELSVSVASGATTPTRRSLSHSLSLDVSAQSFGTGNGSAQSLGEGLSLPFEGPLVVATYRNERDLHATVLALYDHAMNSSSEGAENGDELLRHRLLICSPTTHLPELHMFVHRVFSPARPVHGLFCVLNAHLMSHEARSYLTQALLQAQRHAHPHTTSRLAFVVPLSADKCISELSLEVHSVTPLSPRRLCDMVAQRLRREVLVVTSPMAGLGKTVYVHMHAQERHSRRMVSLTVGDAMTRASLVPRLKGLGLGPDVCLHLDVSSLEYPGEVNMALFELLVLGSLQVGTQIVHLPPLTHTYVEVARAVTVHHGPLRKALFALDAFPEEVLHWDVERLIVSSDIRTDVQVVCNYLLLLERNVLSTVQLRFSGPGVNAVSVTPEECRRLLVRHFYAHFDSAAPPSLNTLRVFLGVLADQLRKFTHSVYFHINYVDNRAVRAHVVQNLLSVSRDFATRSVRHVRRRQDMSQAEELAATVPEWMDLGLVRWEDDNQLMILFHPEGTTLTALYRRLSDVKPEVREMIEEQGREKLRDYFAMTDQELREVLANICGKPADTLGPKEYVLTPDNFLKIAMLITRVQAGIPIVIMGETGCGKTSLINFAAVAMGAALRVLDCHAGRSAEEIIHWVEDCEAAASTGARVWAFLDEINTCNHLSLINDVVCHRQLFGRPIHFGVTFLCAVNPYRLKMADGITAGLDSQQKRNKPDALARLVYRVYPLPETMIDYLWDFGSLHARDEKAYIRAIMDDIGPELEAEALPTRAVDILCDMVSACHELIRAREDRSAVSMRDVRRCKLLARWFLDQKRNGECEGSGNSVEFSNPPSVAELNSSTQTHTNAGRNSVVAGGGASGSIIRKIGRRVRLLLSWDTASRREKEQSVFEAMVLAVAFCYRSRLPLPELRQEMDQRLSQFFRQWDGMDEAWIAQTILQQQRDYVLRLELGPGIALNEALLENTFVLLVCILLKLPVFLVGKPGSSKTLAMKRLESNLRGADSRDPFWRRFGEMKVVSYQGSESSTSEGVLQAFEKAQSYAQVDENRSNVVVLIDEVGLAEISRFNPLKVLHSLLEVSDFDSPAVASQRLAVVGISNWSLDAAKMNRAIHISRPEPSGEQLLYTAEAILDSMGCRLNDDVSGHLRGLSEAYASYCRDQLRSVCGSFHGLRDFYWAMKQLARNTKAAGGAISAPALANALLRNFNGLEHPELTPFDRRLMEVTGDDRSLLRSPELSNVRDLVSANLADRDCRHLMLLCSGNGILNAMDGLFKQAGVGSPRILIGSKLRGDQSEAYSYRVLSEIIQCLEGGVSLVLKDLDLIYGSLYDCLNQAYTLVGGRKHCRIALGAFSNPLCHVDDRVKVVVVVEQAEAHRHDPPFLSRFEKQAVSFANLLSVDQAALGGTLTHWLRDFTTCARSPSSSGPVASFGIADTFTGFTPNALDSLLATLPPAASLSDPSGGVALCKSQLLRSASADGVVRGLSSELATRDPEEARRWCTAYFEDEGHANLPNYLRKHALPIAAKDKEQVGKRSVFRSVVTTFTSLHLFIAERHLDEAGLEGQWLHRRMGAFDTEAALADVVRGFFADPEVAVLLFECDAAYDQPCMLLARFLVDREAADFMSDEADTSPPVENGGPRRKVVVFLTHVSRKAFSNDASASPWEACFTSGWDSFHIDNLLLSNEDWAELRRFLDTTDLRSVVGVDGMFENVSKAELMACFRRLRYGRLTDPSRSVAQRVLDVVNAIGDDKEGLRSLMKDKVLPLVAESTAQHSEGHWLVDVATNRELLELSGFSLANGVRGHIREVVRSQLVKLILALERFSSLDTLLADGFASGPLGAYGRRAFLSDSFINLRTEPTPMATQVCEVESVATNLRFPFSKPIFDSLSSEEQPRFLEEAMALGGGGGTGDDNEGQEEGARAALRARFKAQVSAKISALMGPELASEGQTALRSNDAFVHDMVVLSVATVGGGPTSESDKEDPTSPEEGVASVEDANEAAAARGEGSGSGGNSDSDSHSHKVVAFLSQLLDTLGLRREPEDVVVLLWEKMPLLRSLSRLLTAASDEELGIMLTAFRGQGLESLSYHMCVEAAALMLARCCRGWEDARQWAPQLDEMLRLIGDVHEAAGLPLDGRLYPTDQRLLLLQRLYVLKTIQDAVTLVLPCPEGSSRERTAIPFLHRQVVETLRMDEALLGQIVAWLSPRVGNDAKAAQVLASILERFLFVGTERFYAIKDYHESEEAQDDDEDGDEFEHDDIQEASGGGKPHLHRPLSEEHERELQVVGMGDDDISIEIEDLDDEVVVEVEGAEIREPTAAFSPRARVGDSFLTDRLFLAICRHACSMRHRPPVALTLVLRQILLEVTNGLAEAKWHVLDLVRQGSALPWGIRGTFDPLQEVFHAAHGTPLETLVLDIMGENLDAEEAEEERERQAQAALDLDELTDEEASGRAREDEAERVQEGCETFDKGVANVLREADGQGAHLLVLWLSHAVVKRFLQRAAEGLRAGSVSTKVLETLNTNLSLTPAGSGAQGMLQHLRLFLLKSLRLDTASLPVACSEGGYLAALCPWVMHMDWRPQSDRCLPYNPFQLPDRLAALQHVSEAWDALHVHFIRSPEPLTRVVDLILAASADDPAAVRVTSALVQAIFMRLYGPARRPPVDPRAREQVGRLVSSQEAHSSVRLLGRLALACMDGFGLSGEGMVQEEGQQGMALLPTGEEGLDVQPTATTPLTTPITPATPSSSQAGGGEGSVSPERALETLLLSLMVKAFGEAVQYPGHVLSGYALRPGSIFSSLLLGAESNDLASVVSAMGEAMTRYQCTCGFVFFVSNCGNVMQASKCPVCHRRIGGAQYGTPFDGLVKLDRTPSFTTEREEPLGYVYSPRCGDVVVHTERDLTPNQYRALSLLVHACLLGGAVAHGEGVYRAHIGPSLLEPNALQHCMRVMRASLACLLGSNVVPQGRVDLLGAFLHDLVEGVFANPTLNAEGLCTSPRDRLQREAAFASLCAKRMGDVVGVGSRALERYAEEEMAPLERDLRELRPPASTAHCLHSYRLTQEPTKEALRGCYYRDGSHRELHPLIDVFLQFEARLSALRHLLPLLNWTNAVRKAMNLQLSRDRARTTPHTALWGQFSEGDGPTPLPPTPGLSKKAFDAFKHAWNGFREGAVCRHCGERAKVVDGCGCVEVWVMDEALPLISSCLNSSDEGKVVGLLLGELALVQNTFLSACMSAMGGAGGVSGLVASLPVQRATASVVVEDPQAGVWPTLQQYGRKRLDYGSGHEFEYDLDKLQRVILQRCVGGKAMLEAALEDLTPLRFSHETFASSKALLVLVDQRVAQVPLPDPDRLRMDAMVTDESEVSSRMMPALEALLYMLTTVKGRLDPHMRLPQFADAWLDDVNRGHFAYYARSRCAISGLSLCHVEALYEVLEDTIGEAIIANIPDAYAQPLKPTISAEDVAVLVDYAGGLRAFESAWRRFIIRYLRRPTPLPADHCVDTYATLLRFPPPHPSRRGEGEGSGIDDRADVMDICSRLRLGQAMSLLAHVRALIQLEDEDSRSRRQQAERTAVMHGLAPQESNGSEGGGVGNGNGMGNGGSPSGAPKYRFRQRTVSKEGRTTRRTRGAAI